MGKLLAENEREKPNESMMGEHDYGFGNNSQCVVNPETGTFSQGLLYRLTEHLLDFLFPTGGGKKAYQITPWGCIF